MPARLYSKAEANEVRGLRRWPRAAILGPMRGLFIEPFYGGSHRSFLDGLVRASDHEFELLTLPGENWRRRMRLGALELARQFDRIEGSFDFLIATDMLDLADFLALTRARTSGIPVMTYFHENQFTYPRIRGTKLNSWFGQINYMSALVADQVSFNSAFHQREFVAALRELDLQPNNWLDSSAIDEIEAKSLILPIGLDLGWLDGEGGDTAPRRADGKPPLVLWNHRWEFDKAPEMFARVIRRLADEGLQFSLALAGDRGENPHPGLVSLAEELGGHVVHSGFAASRAEYAALLRRSDIVVSTSRHEFFGVGMVEAMYCGCLPIAPNRLNYPALVPSELHDKCLFDDEAEFTAKFRQAIEQPHQHAATLRRSAVRYDWSLVGREWDGAISRLAAQGYLPG